MATLNLAAAIGSGLSRAASRLRRHWTNHFSLPGRRCSGFGKAAAAVAVAGSMLSCDSTTPTRPTATATATATATVSSVDLVCTSEAALTGRISEFLNAYNAGQPGVTEQFFAPAPAFQWYSEPPNRLHDAAYDRSSLAAYLAQRHADGDHLTLESVSLSGDPVDGIGNSGFVVVRGSTPLQSKGAIDCPTRRFIVYSLGPNPGPD